MINNLKILAFAFLLIGADAFSSIDQLRSRLPISSSRYKRTDIKLDLSPVDAWDSYNQALESNPLLVKSVTAGAILGAADVVGQLFEKKDEDKDIDIARAVRFAIFGLVLQAPWNHFYYLVLDSQIPPSSEPFTPTNGVKVLIDQFIQAPIFTVLIFVFLGALEGKSAAKIQQQLQDDYKDTIVANCEFIWLWCHDFLNISMQFVYLPIFQNRETVD